MAKHRHVFEDTALLHADPDFSVRLFGAPVGASELPPTSGVAANGKPIFSWNEAAAQLTRINLQWSASHGTPAVVTYAFRASATASQFPGDASGFQQFTAAQIAATQEALALWSDVANITFIRVTDPGSAYSNNAAILFGNFTHGLTNSSAYGFYPGSTSATATAGDVWINLAVPENLSELFEGGFGAHTLEHEIGHAIGLAHPGDYDSTNGGTPTYANDAVYWQDTRAFTVMSYFGSDSVGFALGAFSSGPQMHDIAAAQLVYGANMTTRTGDTVYGFNSNTGHAHYSIANSASTPVFCIWDAGGNDTLDLSGYATASQIDLRPESFSSAGPDSTGAGIAIGNISIARGAIIENAIGGSGADIIIGNDVANVLTGNAGADVLTGNGGNDILNGGLGFDAANYASASTAASWHRNPGGSWTITTASEGSDTLSSVELVHFADRDLALHAAARTFTGDGTSDILFQRSDGVVANWNVNGAAITQANFLATAPAQWHALGTGDINGDGAADILWQRDDSLVYTWLMSNGTVSSAVPITGVGNQWSYLGAGDFNGDGMADLAWQRSDGLVSTWSMNGAAIAQANAISGLSSAWHLQGVGDFNSDGRDDFLWRNADSGQMAIWEMNGSSFVASGATSQQAGLEWSVKGVGDFDGDGRDDILMQRGSDGMVEVWSMNGLNVAHVSDVAAANPGQWSLHGVGDYNGDGKDDILWQRADGLVYVWLMDGASIIGASGLSGVDSNWGII